MLFKANQLIGHFVVIAVLLLLLLLLLLLFDIDEVFLFAEGHIRKFQMEFHWRWPRSFREDDSFVFGHQWIRTSVRLWECVCVCVCDYAKYKKNNINAIERFGKRDRNDTFTRKCPRTVTCLSNFSFSVRKTSFYKEQWQVA